MEQKIRYWLGKNRKLANTLMIVACFIPLPFYLVTDNSAYFFMMIGLVVVMLFIDRRFYTALNDPGPGGIYVQGDYAIYNDYKNGKSNYIKVPRDEYLAWIRECDETGESWSTIFGRLKKVN